MADGNRGVEDMHVVPFHEELNKDLEQTPGAADELKGMQERGELPSAYYESPVVQKHGL